MFSSRQPGQTVSTRQSVETEVTISVKQAKIAAVAGGIVAFVVQRIVIVGLGTAIVTRWPAMAARVVSGEILIGSIIVLGAILLPFVALWISMVLQIYDINWPPARRAQDATDGPNAPGILRRLAGWRERKPELEAEAEVEIYDAPVASAADPAMTTVTASLLIMPEGGGNPKHLQTPTLTLEQWRELRMAVGSGKSISVRHLIEAGIAKDAARAINTELRKWPHLIEKREKGRFYCRPCFVKWLREGGYRNDQLLPK